MARHLSLRLAAAILLAGLLAAGVSCAGYRVGPTNGQGAGERSVQVAPFRNETLEPKLGEPVTQALRKRIQQDGTFHLETGGGADVLVQGTISKFERSELSFQPRDVLTVRDYTLTMTARIVAIETSSGRTNLDQIVYGQTVIRAGTDLASAERQALPLLAADLARHAVSYLADGSW